MRVGNYAVQYCTMPLFSFVELFFTSLLSNIRELTDHNPSDANGGKRLDVLVLMALRMSTFCHFSPHFAFGHCLYFCISLLFCPKLYRQNVDSPTRLDLKVCKITLMGAKGLNFILRG